MESILDLDRSEVRALKDTLGQHKDLLLEHAAPIIEDCFHLLLSAQAKGDGFNLLKSLSDANNPQSDQLNDLYNAILSILAQVYRQNLKSWEEFSLILEDMGLKTKASAIQKVFQTVYLKKVEQLGDVMEDEEASMTQ